MDKIYNFVEELKKYFENTSDEQIKIDWEKSQEFDQIDSNFTLLEQISEKNVQK